MGKEIEAMDKMKRPHQDGNKRATGYRFTVDQRRTRRDLMNVKYGNAPGWAEEALDFYLEGEEVAEIRRCFDVSSNVFYSSIAKAALYRLMVQHQAQRLEEIPELTTEHNK